MSRRGARPMRIAVMVCAMACGAARSGVAAGEGFYCTGPDYLAYEFNGDGIHPGEHQLWVVNLSGPSGASAPASIELDAFQTRGIRCLDGAIDLLGRSKVFHVPLDASRQPESPLPRGIVPHARPTAFDSPESLGASAAAFASGDLPARITLEAPRTLKRFALAMTGSAHRSAANRSPCAIDAETRLLQLNADGTAERALTIFRGVVMHTCGPTDFDDEAADGTGAVLPAPPCAAEAGRQARQATGEVTEGTDVVTPIGPFQLQLRSEGEDGWDLAVLEPGRLDNLAQLTSPPSGPSPLDLLAWQFRNDDNTGPPVQSFADGGRHRRFIFSPEIGRTMRFNLDTLVEDRERAASYGRGSFDILAYEMTPRQLGESPRVLWMKFSACLTWPQ